jgi:hypothetical protein
MNIEKAAHDLLTIGEWMTEHGLTYDHEILLRMYEHGVIRLKHQEPVIDGTKFPAAVSALVAPYLLILDVDPAEFVDAMDAVVNPRTVPLTPKKPRHP